MRKKKKAEPATSVMRIQPEYTKGLTTAQVQERMSAGASNQQLVQLTRSIPAIVFKHVFTLFNLLNIALAVVILILGDWKNTLFIGVAVSNTAIGIFQEVRAKQTIDKLSILAKSKVTVIREGNEQKINQEELVLDDIMLIAEGNQIPADGMVVFTEGMEVDESPLTGESDQIRKISGSKVMSGSFVTAGSAYVLVEAVGKDSYATKLSVEAKKEKKKHSKLMSTLNNIIRVLTVVIVPVGALLFYTQYSQGTAFKTSVLGATAAMLGMIPEGLMLLTSVTFAVGAINLAKQKTLVQSLPSIETLARVDVLCLDKTGTITDGKMNMEQVIPVSQKDYINHEEILSEVMFALKDNNPTALAIRGKYGQYHQWQAVRSIPFSSGRKWSGASFVDHGTYLLGAPDFMFSQLDPEIGRKINDYSSRGYRVLALVHSEQMIEEDILPDDLECLALLLLTDNIRANASKTFRYFAEQGVEIKVISGDNPITVSHIATKAGIANAEHYIDMSTVSEGADFCTLVKENTVFGRVSPYQKRELVQALQKNGSTVCMTGDGVNDVLALKEADCAVAMVGGSDAARSVADFVLLSSNFGAMVEVLKEGRRVINNIETVASLYLVKTIYSTLLALLYIYIPYPYPFSPSQMSPINALTVGIPSFFLALEANYGKPKGRFIANVLENAFPAALTVVFNILVIQLASIAFGLTQQETGTMAVLVTGAVGFVLLYRLSKPFNWKKGAMLGLLAVAFVAMLTVPIAKNFFVFSDIFTRNAFFYLPLVLSCYSIFSLINRVVVKIEDKFLVRKEKRRKKKQEDKRRKIVR